MKLRESQRPQASFNIWIESTNLLDPLWQAKARTLRETGTASPLLLRSESEHKSKLLVILVGPKSLL